MFVGNRKNRKIGFVNVCWAPMEALIVQSAKAEDGVSNQYFPNQTIFKSSDVLVQSAKEILSSESFPYQVGHVVTTSAMFLETQKIVNQWNQEGYIGVDGETATTLSVAQRFGAEAVSLLTCSDNLALGDNIYESDNDRQNKEATAFERTQKLALQLSSS